MNSVQNICEWFFLKQIRFQWAPTLDLTHSKEISKNLTWSKLTACLCHFRVCDRSNRPHLVNNSFPFDRKDNAS